MTVHFITHKRFLVALCGVFSTKHAHTSSPAVLVWQKKHFQWEAAKYSISLYTMHKSTIEEAQSAGTAFLPRMILQSRFCHSTPSLHAKHLRVSAVNVILQLCSSILFISFNLRDLHRQGHYRRYNAHKRKYLNQQKQNISKVIPLKHTMLNEKKSKIISYL